MDHAGKHSNVSLRRNRHHADIKARKKTQEELAAHIRNRIGRWSWGDVGDVDTWPHRLEDDEGYILEDV